MKQAEIKKDTDYIIGPSNNLWDGVEYSRATETSTYVPYRLTHVRIVDNRRYKASTMYSSHRGEPKLLEEGEKPNRSYYSVGALARGVKNDGTLADHTFVVRPQEVRMEWDAWREEFARRAKEAKEARAARAERVRLEEEARRAFTADRQRRVIELNTLLEGTPLEAKIAGTEVVLTGAPADLVDAAEKLSKVVVP